MGFPLLKYTLPFLLLVITFPKGSPLGFSKDYNPLKPPEFVNFKRNTEWESYLEGGPLSAYVADFVKGRGLKKECVRVVLFMGDEAVLDYVVADCDTPKDLTMGLTFRSKTLKYYDAIAVQPEGDGYFSIIKRTKDKDKCVRTKYYVEKCLDECTSPAKQKVEPTDTVTGCWDLDDIFVLPPLWLVSLKQDIGKFRPASGNWDYIFNPWDHLGFVSREYNYKSPSFYFKQTKCFRLVAVTTYGKVIKVLKLSCGKITDVTSTDRTLRLGNALYVKRSKRTESTRKSRKFTILYNQEINCVKENVVDVIRQASSSLMTVRLGLPTSVYSKIVSMENDNTCTRLVKGTLKDNTVKTEDINRIKSYPIRHAFMQHLVQDYYPVGEAQYYNIGTQMGVKIQTYNRRSDHEQHHIVSLFVQGLPLVPIIVDALPSRTLVVRKNEIYYGKDMAFLAVEGEHLHYRVYQKENINPVSSQRSNYILNEERILEEIKDYDKNVRGKRSSIDFVSSKGTGDSFCKLLIKGWNLRKEAKWYSRSDTDNMGVPKSLKYP